MCFRSCCSAAIILARIATACSSCPCRVSQIVLFGNACLPVALAEWLCDSECWTMLSARDSPMAVDELLRHAPGRLLQLTALRHVSLRGAGSKHSHVALPLVLYPVCLLLPLASCAAL